MVDKNKPILCLDFDGVIHSYSSGWKGADVIPDPPVLGAMDFIERATHKFRVAVYSSRSGQNGGVKAMQAWLEKHMVQYMDDDAFDVLAKIEWPQTKPPAKVSIDDRAITFTGVRPDLCDLENFKPWNKV